MKKTKESVTIKPEEYRLDYNLYLSNTGPMSDAEYNSRMAHDNEGIDIDDVSVDSSFDYGLYMKVD